MEYAETLIKGKKTADDLGEDSEESWTFIGEDQDPDLMESIHRNVISRSGIVNQDTMLSSDEEGEGSKEIHHRSLVL